jgi:hypothetical protein
VLALAAERAVERIFRLATADLAHSVSPSADSRAGKPAALPQTITGAVLRVRSANVTGLHAFRAILAKSPLANHGTDGIIKNLLINQR